jgi:hypothetical protein
MCRIMWRIDPLLGKDLETNNEATVVMQRHDKHASTTELLLETVFSTRCVQRRYKEESLGVPVSCKSATVKVGPERGKLKNLHC